ncbi:MAG: outer membrane protein assembly factor BamD [Lautropia sp.]|nr:outer membrane protein assembly factor BamD [Lautropia sp.]
MLQAKNRNRRNARGSNPFWLSVLTAAALLAGCAAVEKDPTADWSADQLYADAKAELDAGNWASAIKALQRLESRYPFGSYAQQAQLDIAWAHYKEGERSEALSAIDRFIRLHPAHARLDYAYYMKGLINFTSRETLISRWAGQDSSERDLHASREAYDAFQQVVNRFPSSRYRQDSLDRMRALVNSMASGEVHVARYYYSRNAFVASANRAQGVLSQYQGTPATEEALYILASSYNQLNLPELRDDATRVLARTYPDSAYLAQLPKVVARDPAKEEAAKREKEANPIKEEPASALETPPYMPTMPSVPNRGSSTPSSPEPAGQSPADSMMTPF